MADDRTERPVDRTNDPVTAPERHPDAEARNPRQSEVNAPKMTREEAASRATARETGRSAAKWFAVGLAVLIAFFVVAAFLGGGAWVWGPADPEPVMEGTE